jgi:membrane associated rhomboid family serine protease
MFPLIDDVPHRRTPYVSYALILINVLVFLWEISLGPQLDAVIQQIAFVPARFAPTAGLGAWIPIFTSMFLHAGSWHLVSNMVALWIFGDNVEDRLGHGRFLLLYLLSGVIAALVHYAFNTASPVPTVGASGAIAGVLGAYLLLYPHANVYTLMFIPFFWMDIVRIRAVVYLGIWLFTQLFNGLFTLALNTVQSTGGVAWWAHIGGFVAGVVLVWLLRPAPEPRWPDEYRAF